MMERSTHQDDIEWEKLPDFIPGMTRYQGTQDPNLRAVVSNMPGEGWHVSVSHKTRYPTWDEIADARYKFVPNRLHMVMALPPREEFVNLHDNCLHLYEERKSK